MRTNAIQLLLLAVTFAALGACGSGQEAEVSSSTAGAPATDPAAGELAVASGQAHSDEPATTGAPLAVSRTREGNGGIIVVAGEMSMEFDYSPPQGRCRASEGKFDARGIDITDDKAGVSINYQTVVAPDTGSVVGRSFILEVKKDGYVTWATTASLAGSIEDVSLHSSEGGGTVLTLTGTVSGFHENRVPTGTKVPFRMEATCVPTK